MQKWAYAPHGNTKLPNGCPCLLVDALKALFYGIHLFVLAMVSVSSLVFSFPAVGFSGSRHFSSSASVAALAFLPSVSGFSGSVGVGCACGVDSLVRSAFPAAQVFRVQPPISRRAFALRSARLVRWVAASSGLLVVFPSTACPAGVVPSGSFRGFGSGSWGSAAFAVGLGVPVLLFVPASLTSASSVQCGSAFPAPPALAWQFRHLGSASGGSWWLSG